MLRKIIADDFNQSGRALKNLEEVSLWFRCDEYLIQGDAVVARYSYPRNEGKWSFYRPLESEPALFLKFARLYEAPDFKGAVLSWCQKYGVLKSEDPYGRLGRRHKVPLAWFHQEAKRAWIVLTMYESVLREDAQGIRSLLRQYKDEQLILSMLSNYQDVHLSQVPLSGSSAEQLSDKDLFDFAFTAYIWEANRSVDELCHQYLAPHFRATGKGFMPDPANVKKRWRFDSLLGAMYLQLFWMIEAGGSLTRCVVCGQIISQTPPEPGKRKRRSDLKTCGDACRQAKHRSEKVKSKKA